MSEQSAPPVGTIVHFISRTDTSHATRKAVVVGRADWNHAELHLAVLTPDGENLDLLSLAVPPDPTGVCVGTWHAPPAAEWPTEQQAEEAS